MRFARRGVLCWNKLLLRMFCLVRGVRVCAFGRRGLRVRAFRQRVLRVLHPAVRRRRIFRRTRGRGFGGLRRVLIEVRVARTAGATVLPVNAGTAGHRAARRRGNRAERHSARHSRTDQQRCQQDSGNGGAPAQSDSQTATQMNLLCSVKKTPQDGARSVIRTRGSCKVYATRQRVWRYRVAPVCGPPVAAQVISEASAAMKMRKTRGQGRACRLSLVTRHVLC